MKILQVNNIDLQGRRFNGYDLINDFIDKNDIDIKQAVIIKQSKNPNVVNYINDLESFYKILEIENNVFSVHSIFSITSPALLSLKEYKEADIVHFHMFHNSRLSLYSLDRIAKEKKVVITLHDPWFLTGRCVHFYDCDEWVSGCNNCEYLDTIFPFTIDNCASLWKLKRKVLNNPNISIIVTTPWMKNLTSISPITKDKEVYLIPLGIDTKKFSNSISSQEARKHFNISLDETVLFFRAQREFKGTDYIIKALSKLNSKKKITLLTCSIKGLLVELKDKYRIIDLGIIEDDEMIKAYSACDVFLMPSTGESFGFMAIEAMSCSKPVIIFDNTALPSSTFAPECGILVKNLDVNDLKDKIEFILNNESERIKRGKLGRKIVEKNYNIDNHISEMYRMYKHINNKELITIAENSTGSKKEEIKIKHQLNVFTEIYFRNNEKYIKLLKYNLPKKFNFDKTEKLDYSDDLVMQIVEKYFERLYRILLAENNKKKNKTIKFIKNKIRKNKKLYDFLKKIIKNKKI